MRVLLLSVFQKKNYIQIVIHDKNKASVHNFLVINLVPKLINIYLIAQHAIYNMRFKLVADWQIKLINLNAKDQEGDERRWEHFPVAVCNVRWIVANGVDIVSIQRKTKSLQIIIRYFNIPIFPKLSKIVLHEFSISPILTLVVFCKQLSIWLLISLD